MNYHLVYQPFTIGDILLVYFEPHLKPTHHEVVGKMVKIFHLHHLIGVNFLQASLQFKNLPTGIMIKPAKELLQAINQIFQKENIEPLLPLPSGYVIAQIESKKEHPESENLFICQLYLGDAPDQSPIKMTVVTNSIKVKEQDYVVVAKAGTLLMDGTFLVPTPFKGIVSEGMLCSSQTLRSPQLQQEGVYVFTKTQPLGKDFFGLDHVRN
jgi:tRNA-binding EMAP/Myf-like protein